MKPTNSTLAGCCMAILGVALSQTAYAQRGPAPVIVTKVVERELAKTQDFVGTVRPLRLAIGCCPAGVGSKTASSAAVTGKLPVASSAQVVSPAGR